MNIKEVAERGIVSDGNLSRMAGVMKKAKRGEDIVVAFLGGSITMGSVSSTPQTCYAYLVYEWWTKRFPDSTIKYVNAGIGATTSQFAVARAESDLLILKPDMISVEFSVNDTSSDLFKETYEGLIRRILESEQAPAVMIINNLFYDNGMNAQDIHNAIGAVYQLPMVSIRDSIYPEIKEGRLIPEEVTPDNLHPNDTGHKLLAEIIDNFLDHIYNTVMREEFHAQEYKIPAKTITQNRYMDSVRYQNKNILPEFHGFIKDSSEQNGITDVFKNGWYGKKIGDSIRFEVSGGMISVQYKKTIKRVAPVAIAIIDGDEVNAIRLDANFEETWGDCIYLEDLLVGGSKEKHILEVRIVEQDTESDLEFYLISVIVADR